MVECFSHPKWWNAGQAERQQGHHKWWRWWWSTKLTQRSFFLPLCSSHCWECVVARLWVSSLIRRSPDISTAGAPKWFIVLWGPLRHHPICTIVTSNSIPGPRRLPSFTMGKRFGFGYKILQYSSVLDSEINFLKFQSLWLFLSLHWTFSVLFTIVHRWHWMTPLMPLCKSFDRIIRERISAFTVTMRDLHLSHQSDVCFWSF